MNKTKFQLWKSELVSKPQPNNLINGLIVNKNASFQKTMSVSAIRPQPIPTQTFEVKPGVVSGRDVLSLRFPLFDTKYPAPQKLSASFDEKRAVNVQAGPKAISADVVKALEDNNVDITKITTGSGSYTTARLQEIARILGLPVSGTKAQMVQRILSSLGL